jgi:AcrR family transcriptional regulator
MDDIGAAVGITGPGLYRYFPSKEEILKALVQEAVERMLVERVPSPLEVDEPPEQQLNRVIMGFVDNIFDNRQLAAVVWKERRSLAPEAQAWLARYHRLRAAEWVHVLSRCRPALRDLELLTMVNGTYGMIIEAAQHDEGLDDQRARALICQFASRALLQVEPPGLTRRHRRSTT